ncbi:hypothetical protein OAL44_01405 [Planctomycetaceae bacterium]|nr:hypothetical protein [bacterium]MDC0307769.1 hypothetical protein [Planctomycetaceae bacterium]
MIDGHDISDLIHGIEGAKSSTDAFYYYARTKLRAVRVGRWKLHIPTGADARWKNFSKPNDAAAIVEPLLFDLETDLSEKQNLADQHPEVVTELMRSIEHARDDIGDVDRIGKNARFFDPQPKRPDIRKPKQ